MHKPLSCCFIGHRKLPGKRIEYILEQLNVAVEKLVKLGVTTFISGGAPGFDQIASSLIIARKEMGRNIRLVFALPCKEPDQFWAPKQQEFYANLLEKADQIIYVSAEYRDNCIERHNRFLIDQSAYCICACLYPIGVTAQRIRYARKRGLRVINVARKNPPKSR
ncbi:MAG: DUF1273 domain-containing protein [Firmicutes bacterium]|nr:DUF1273 domain-containing protein [Bacillota bacterium]